ncbi:MAG: twin-arginine translocase subunit TatB [Deltaproteobacteria bacterium]|nr:twin-arginine translocase subunit TatB [Deltaproteobacteria bacterium]MBW2199785.1 twin-arginine translocase subunit TatB [Deltaproteobacteria bacterium]MBW2539953.1 twin-arginine translocase subunit TatB [Deltaproteobacteria bacterium]
MFGIGMPELILIMVVALIVIGPKKLPDLAKSLGRALGEFKKATREFKETIEFDHGLDDVKKTFNEMNKDITETIDVNSKEKKSDQSEPGVADTAKSETTAEKEKSEGRTDDS